MTTPEIEAVIEARLDFSQGNILYLSDLTPEVSPPAAAAGPPFPFRVNQTDEKNAPLRLDGVSYAKGLWVRADTTLAYKLTGEYREFKALVGVDESVSEPSYSVRLVIEADGKVTPGEWVPWRDARVPPRVARAMPVRQ